MKTFALICVALLPLSLLAQDTIPGISEIEPGYRPKNRFYVGAFVSPDLSYSIIQREDAGMASLKTNNSNYDISKFSVTVGFEAMYQVNQHLAISMGVHYSGKGGKTKEIEYSLQSPSGVANRYYVYDYRYIDIPVRLDVYLNRRRVAPFITAGVSTNVFINQRTHQFTVEMNDEAMEESNSSSSGFQGISPQFQLGAGIDITLKYSRIRIFPIYRATFTTIPVGGTYDYAGQPTGSVKANLYSIGLGINCMLRL